MFTGRSQKPGPNRARQLAVDRGFLLRVFVQIKQLIFFPAEVEYEFIALVANHKDPRMDAAPGLHGIVPDFNRLSDGGFAGSKFALGNFLPEAFPLKTPGSANAHAL